MQSRRQVLKRRGGCRLQCAEKVRHSNSVVRVVIVGLKCVSHTTVGAKRTNSDSDLDEAIPVVDGIKSTRHTNTSQ